MINILWSVLALIGLAIVIIAQNKIKDIYYKIGLLRGYSKGYEDGLNMKHPLSHLELFEKFPINEVGKEVEE